MDDVDDRELVGRCQDELPYVTTAFEELLRRHEPLVFRTCRRYLSHDQEAEEACQDIFLRVFHGLPNFAQRSAFRTWLFRITANVCKSRYARLAKRAANEALFRHRAAQETDRGYEPEDRQLDEIKGSIGEGLDLLAHVDREVLILRHVAGLSLNELSAALALRLSATKMRLYRAEQRLRQAYEQITENTEE